MRSRGQNLFDNPPPGLRFSPGVTRLTDNLHQYPHAFVFACIFDRQVPTEKSEYATLELQRRVGDFSFEALAGLSLDQVLAAMTHPTKLHRFPSDMAVNI